MKKSGNNFVLCRLKHGLSNLEVYCTSNLEVNASLHVLYWLASPALKFHTSINGSSFFFFIVRGYMGNGEEAQGDEDQVSQANNK